MNRGTITHMPSGANILQSAAAAIVSPIDCTGAQGAGLALAIAKRYPSAGKGLRAELRELAARECPLLPSGALTLSAAPGRQIIFVATKKHWRDPSRLEWVRTGLTNLRHEVLTNNIHSVAIPPLGCGLGGLRWEDVRPLNEAEAERLAEVGVDVELYLPLEG